MKKFDFRKFGNVFGDMNQRISFNKYFLVTKKGIAYIIATENQITHLVGLLEENSNNPTIIVHRDGPYRETKVPDGNFPMYDVLWDLFYFAELSASKMKAIAKVMEEE